MRPFGSHLAKLSSAGTPSAGGASGARVAWLLLPILTLVWGATWPIMKIALAYSGPFGFNASRYVVGTVVAFGWLAMRGVRLQSPPWIPTIVVGLTQTAAFQSLAELALVRGGAGKTSLIVYTMPFWAVLLAWLWLHERLGPKRIACIGVAAAGLLFVIRPWRSIGDPLSVASALGSGFCWAIGVVVTKRTFQRHPRLTPAQLTAWQLLVGTAVLVALALFIPERTIVWAPTYVATVLFTGVFATGLGWIVWTLIVQHLPANVAGLTSLGVPVTGVLLSWGLLGERPAMFEALGMVLIGLAILGLNFAREAPHAAAAQQGPPRRGFG